MEQSPRPRRRRLNIVAKTARTLRIFARLREGWAYDDIAKEEHLSAERVRQIVKQVLERRVVDTTEDHAHLQLERLRPALKLAGEAVERGDLSAVGPLIKIIDRLDRHRIVFKRNLYSEDDHRQRLLDKLNWAAANLAEDEEDPVSAAPPVEPEADSLAEPGSDPARPEDFFTRGLPVSR